MKEDASPMIILLKKSFSHTVKFKRSNYLRSAEYRAKNNVS